MRNTPTREGGGVNCQLPGDNASHSTSRPSRQQNEDPKPAIHLTRDGPLFRVQIFPPDALPPSFAVPSTYLAVSIARMSAKVLSDATGWPVTDLTDVRS